MGGSIGRETANEKLRERAIKGTCADWSEIAMGVCAALRLPGTETKGAGHEPGASHLILFCGKPNPSAHSQIVLLIAAAAAVAAAIAIVGTALERRTIAVWLRLVARG
jgi:hypothetical protein